MRTATDLALYPFPALQAKAGGGCRVNVGSYMGRQQRMSPRPGPSRLPAPRWGLWSWSRITYLESANSRILQREPDPAQGQKWCHGGCPKGGSDSTQQWPCRSLSLQPQLIPSTPSPHSWDLPTPSLSLAPNKGTPSATPGPVSGCSPLYLPTSRLPTMRPDRTLMTADTFPV